MVEREIERAKNWQTALNVNFIDRRFEMKLRDERDVFFMLIDVAKRAGGR